MEVIFQLKQLPLCLFHVLDPHARFPLKANLLLITTSSTGNSH